MAHAKYNAHTKWPKDFIPSPDDIEVDENGDPVTKLHMTPTLITHAVFDEAGDTGSQQHSSRYLVIAGVICDDLTHIRRVIGYVRKRLDKRERDLSEFKGADLGRKLPRIIAQVLTRLATLDVQIYAAILDKLNAPPTDDPEDWYRSLCSQCINLTLLDHPHLQVLIDRRYTKLALQERLDRTISENQMPNTSLFLTPGDSRADPALQVADLVAWAVLQKYEHEDHEFYAIVGDKIAREVAQ